LQQRARIDHGQAARDPLPLKSAPGKTSPKILPAVRAGHHNHRRARVYPFHHVLRQALPQFPVIVMKLANVSASSVHLDPLHSVFHAADFTEHNQTALGGNTLWQPLETVVTGKNVMNAAGTAGHSMFAIVYSIITL
jgi:hypothetical protein